MNVLEQLFAAAQYSLPQADKQKLLTAELQQLTAHHRDHCEPYRRILAASPDELPLLPARLFKTLKLQSVPDAAVIRVLTSSGTTSQAVSRIAVDKETAQLQTRALAEIIKAFVGPKRLPMILIDSAATLKSDGSLSARGAGVVGLSNFGRDHFYALDAEMRLDLAGLKAFAERHRQEPILIFGFTFMVWQYFYNELRRAGETLALNNAILLHSGGWKKLQEQAVSNERFKQDLRQQYGIARIHNFYGMVEQVGSIYMECEHGYLHTPNFAEIVIRDPQDWRALPPGQSGIIQTLSVLPRSFPGHSLLTEDLGTIHGVDDCPCGRKGTYFRVQGRIPQAELRGCSDTYAYSAPAGTAAIRQFLPLESEIATAEQLCSDRFCRQPLLRALDAQSVDFLAAVSEEIFRLPDVNHHPELAALAFWLRKANVTAMVESFRRNVSQSEAIMPRGLAFHVAPSNVDTIFVYSWALSILAGNHNIVRISQTPAPQMDELLGALRTVLAKPEWRAFAERNVVLTYPHDEQVNRWFSLRADARIVWGGDATVQTIRALPAKPATKDIVFADKVSHAAVHAAQYLARDDSQAAAIAQAFYNDAYQFGQMACSSPRCVFFVGTPDICQAASRRFWSKLSEELRRVGAAEPAVAAMNKLSSVFELAAANAQARPVLMPSAASPTVVHLPASEAIVRVTCGDGFFIESFLERLEELADLVQPNNQTLIYAGWTSSEMTEAAQSLCRNGFDRVVPFGQALTFAPIWDGYVLLAELTRRVAVR